MNSIDNMPAGRFLNVLDIFNGAFYSLGLATIVLTDQPKLDIFHCFSLIGLLGFLALDGILKHVLKQELFPVANLGITKGRAAAMISLLSTEIIGLFFYAFWASSALWSRTTVSTRGPEQLYGVFCVFAAVYNILCLFLLSRRGELHNLGVTEGKKGWGAVILASWRAVRSYLRYTLFGDAREWPPLQISSEFWLGFLKKYEEEAIGRINSRMTPSVGSETENTEVGLDLHDYGCVIWRRFLLHFGLQVSAMHLILFNSVFAVMLIYSGLLNYLHGVVGNSLQRFIQWKIWIPSTYFGWVVMLVFVAILAYWISAKRELRRCYHWKVGKLVEKLNTHADFIEVWAQGIGNWALLLLFAALLIEYRAQLVYLALASQGLIMVLMALTNLVKISTPSDAVNSGCRVYNQNL